METWDAGPEVANDSPALTLGHCLGSGRSLCYRLTRRQLDEVKQSSKSTSLECQFLGRSYMNVQPYALLRGRFDTSARIRT